VSRGSRPGALTTRKSQTQKSLFCFSSPFSLLIHSTKSATFSPLCFYLVLPFLVHHVTSSAQPGFSLSAFTAGRRLIIESDDRDTIVDTEAPPPLSLTASTHSLFAGRRLVGRQVVSGTLPTTIDNCTITHLPHREEAGCQRRGE